MELEDDAGKVIRVRRHERVDREGLRRQPPCLQVLQEDPQLLQECRLAPRVAVCLSTTKQGVEIRETNPQGGCVTCLRTGYGAAAGCDSGATNLPAVLRKEV